MPRPYPRSQRGYLGRDRSAGSVLRDPHEQQRMRRCKKRRHFSTQRGMGMMSLPGPVPPGSVFQGVVEWSLSTRHHREPPAFSPCPSSGQTGHRPRTLRQQLVVGYRRGAACHLDSRSVGVILLASCLAGAARAAAWAPPAPGLPVRDFVVGRWGSRSEKYHVILMP